MYKYARKFFELAIFQILFARIYANIFFLNADVTVLSSLSVICATDGSKYSRLETGQIDMVEIVFHSFSYRWQGNSSNEWIVARIEIYNVCKYIWRIAN